MALWQIEFSKEAFKAYRKLPKEYQLRIDKALFLLSRKERIDLKPVKGFKDVYRIRIGKFRILIKAERSKRIMLVFKIASRGDIYKKM